MTDSDSTKAPWSTAKKGWVTAAVIAGLLVLFQDPILDTLVKDTVIASYGYCSDFDTCVQQSATAMIEVRQEVGEDMAQDCLAAHQTVIARLATAQNAQERVGLCAVTGAVVNGGVGAGYWTLGWLTD